jgi:hypothetical protein
MNTLDHSIHTAGPELHRFTNNENGIIGYDVLDAFNRSIGRIETLWKDRAGKVLFAGVATAWIIGKIFVLPLYGLQLDAEHQTAQFPYPSDTIKEAPMVDPASALRGREQQSAYATFRLAAPASVLEENMQGLHGNAGS